LLEVHRYSLKGLGHGGGDLFQTGPEAWMGHSHEEMLEARQGHLLSCGVHQNSSCGKCKGKVTPTFKEKEIFFLGWLCIVTLLLNNGASLQNCLEEAFQWANTGAEGKNGDLELNSFKNKIALRGGPTDVGFKGDQKDYFSSNFKLLRGMFYEDKD
jgi:hypothetical protein